MSKSNQVPKTIHFLLIILWQFSQTALTAQESRQSAWLFSAGSYKIKGKLNVIYDVQFRTSDGWKQPETFILRPALALTMPKGSQLSMGFGWVRNWRNVSGIRDGVNDNRIWQQWIKVQSFSSSTLQHRLRLEERFVSSLQVSGNQLLKRNPQFNARLRYFNRFIQPFKKTGKLTKGPYWVLQNEIFVNLVGSKSTHGHVFDQSRTYAGTGIRLNTAVDLEMGWMAQYALGRNSNHIVNNILQVSSFLRL